MSTTEIDLGSLEGLLAELQGDYAAAHPSSEELYERALAALPGGNSRSQLYFDPFPFYVERSEGARIYDVDGNDYLDLVNNYTSLVHGHATKETRQKLIEQVRRGTAFGAPTEVEVSLAEEIVSRVESIGRVRFANSGTEACLYAIRTARAFTGRHDIIKAEGGYNGGFESAQVAVKHVGAANESVAEAGIPPDIAAHTHIIPFNDTEQAVRIIEDVGPAVGSGDNRADAGIGRFDPGAAGVPGGGS